MQSNYYKLVIAVLVVAIFGVSLLLYLTSKKRSSLETPTTEKTENVGPIRTLIGKSVQGRNIDAYSYGDGETTILFVGGIHGGYEWNTIVLADKVRDYLDLNPKIIPENLTVTVIPSLNPDGAFKIVGKEGRFLESDIPQGKPIAPGRFNANEVDLNRNFDCKWQPKSTWQQKTVSAGTSPFSEPETLALKKFIEEKKPKAVIFWHSQGNAVYASECEKGILPETLKIMNAYAKASGYPANPTYDAYQTTGDADAWLAKIGIPAITVELKTHESIDLEQNLAGISAVLDYYRFNKVKIDTERNPTQ